MLFSKLFRLLVLGGAIVGSASGCAGPGQAQPAADKKAEDRDGGASSDSRSAQTQDADGGTAQTQAADGGSAADGGGGGVLGW